MSIYNTCVLYRQSIYELLSYDAMSVARESFPEEGESRQAAIALMLRHLAPGIQTAKIVLWDNDIMLAACEGADAFKGQRFSAEDMAMPPMFWILKEPWWAAPGVDLEGEPQYVKHDDTFLGVFILTAPPGLKAVIPETMPPERPAKMVMWVLQRGKGLHTHSPVLLRLQKGHMAPDSIIMPQYLETVACMRFMRLPLYKEAMMNPSNSERRRLQRHGGIDGKLPDVHVVELRQVQYQRREKPAEGEGKHIDYSCAFWVGGVTGFWRTGKHLKDGRVLEPEYVRPYMKGVDESNPNKPIRMGGTLFHVRR